MVSGKLANLSGSMVFFWLPGCKFSFKGSLSHNSAKHLFLTTVQLRTANFEEPIRQKLLVSQRHCCSANPKISLGIGPFSNSVFCSRNHCHRCPCSESALALHHLVTGICRKIQRVQYRQRCTRMSNRWEWYSF